MHDQADFVIRYASWSSTNRLPNMVLPSTDIEHAVRLSVLSIEIDDDKPRRILHLGPDQANGFLEIVTLEFDDGRSVVIHAMKMRQKYAHLLLEQLGGDDNG